MKNDASVCVYAGSLFLPFKTLSLDVVFGSSSWWWAKSSKNSLNNSTLWHLTYSYSHRMLLVLIENKNFKNFNDYTEKNIKVLAPSSSVYTRKLIIIKRCLPLLATHRDKISRALALASSGNSCMGGILQLESWYFPWESSPQQAFKQYARSANSAQRCACGAFLQHLATTKKTAKRQKRF